MFLGKSQQNRLITMPINFFKMREMTKTNRIRGEREDDKIELEHIQKEEKSLAREKLKGHIPGNRTE